MRSRPSVCVGRHHDVTCQVLVRKEEPVLFPQTNVEDLGYHEVCVCSLTDYTVSVLSLRTESALLDLVPLWR